MGERNDLIMELTEIAQDRHGAKNTHLLSWLEKGYFHCQYGSEEWCQGDYLDSARAYIERLEAVAKDALTTIASLSEALAEAEKKALERAAEAVRVLSYKQGTNSPAWIALRQAEDRIRNLSAPPRDLSQGGQHG